MHLQLLLLRVLAVAGDDCMFACTSNPSNRASEYPHMQTCAFALQRILSSCAQTAAHKQMHTCMCQKQPEVQIQSHCNLTSTCAHAQAPAIPSCSGRNHSCACNNAAAHLETEARPAACTVSLLHHLNCDVGLNVGCKVQGYLLKHGCHLALDLPQAC